MALIGDQTVASVWDKLGFGCTFDASSYHYDIMCISSVASHAEIPTCDNLPVVPLKVRVRKSVPVTCSSSTILVQGRFGLMFTWRHGISTATHYAEISSLF